MLSWYQSCLSINLTFRSIFHSIIWKSLWFWFPFSFFSFFIIVIIDLNRIFKCLCLLKNTKHRPEVYFKYTIKIDIVYRTLRLDCIQLFFGFYYLLFFSLFFLHRHSLCWELKAPYGNALTRTQQKDSESLETEENDKRIWNGYVENVQNKL